MHADPAYRAARADRPIDIRLIENPIDVLADEHLRHRKVLADLDAIVARSPDPRLARAALAHIENELPVHEQDEEDDLFPLLRRRAEPDDAIEDLLARVENHRAGQDVTAVSEALRRLVAGLHLDADDADAIAVYTAAARRQLIFENAIVVPLARVRLTAADRRTLALRMAARRGICLVPETDDA